MAMKKVVSAKEVLTNPRLKQKYDRELKQHSTRTAEEVATATKTVFFVKPGSTIDSMEASSSRASATCFPMGTWTNSSQLEFGDRGLQLPDSKEIPWLEGRRDYLLHHIDRIDEYMSQLKPTNTLQFSILGVNMGNLNRHGHVSGYHHDNMVMTYCTGKFHLALVAEPWLDKRARMTCNTFDMSVFQSSSGAAAIWILGNGKNRRCETLVERTILSDGIRKDGSKNWHLDYMIGEAFWGDHDDGSSVTRCGVPSLRCGVAHLNNKSADKPRLQMLRAFWYEMINARVQVVCGDFNKRAYLDIRNEVDRPNNTMKYSLEQSILYCDVEVKFQMIRIDTGLCPGEFVLSVDSEQDCMLFFLLDYEDVEFKITEQHVLKTRAPLDNVSLGLKPTDKDWHIPILVHVRSSDVSSGKRQRNPETLAVRKKADTQRRNAAKRAKAKAQANK